jgi:hypothetical protein
MSTHADPRKDKYLDLEKKLGAEEYEIAAGLAETDKELDATREKGKAEAETAGRQLKRKLDEHPPKGGH